MNLLSLFCLAIFVLACILVSAVRRLREPLDDIRRTLREIDFKLAVRDAKAPTPAPSPPPVSTPPSFSTVSTASIASSAPPASTASAASPRHQNLSVPPVPATPAGGGVPRIIPDAPTSPFERFCTDVEATVADWLLVRGRFAPSGTNREFSVATHWLARVGALLVVGGLAYFLKLSIDRGWIAPAQRVTGVLAASAAAAWGGVRLVRRTRYGLVGHAFAAAGFAGLYLGFGLGLDFFDPPVFSSRPLVFAAMAATTVAAGLVAARLPSSFIALLGFAGGFATPFVAGSESARPDWFFAYNALLASGAFAVARARHWFALDVLAAFACPLAALALFPGRTLGTPAAVLFALFAHVLLAAAIVREGALRAAPLAFATPLCLAAHAALDLLFFARGGAPTAVFPLVAAGHAALALAARRRLGASDAGVALPGCIATLFLAASAVALPTRASADWIPALASGGALLALGLAAAVRSRATGAAAFWLLGASVLLSFGFAADAYCAAAPRFGAFVVRLAKLGPVVSAVSLAASRTIFPEPANDEPRRGWTATAISLGLLLALAEAHVWECLDGGLVTIALALYAFGLLWAGLLRRVRSLRLAALCLLAAAVSKILFVDTAALPMPARAVVFGLVGGLLVLGAALYIRFRQTFLLEKDSDRTPNRDKP